MQEQKKAYQWILDKEFHAYNNVHLVCYENICTKVDSINKLYKLLCLEKPTSNNLTLKNNYTLNEKRS